MKEQNGRRVTTWWPQFRPIDTATVTPDPEVAAAVAKYEAEFTREMDVPLGTTAVELDSRNATVRTREAAIGNLIADAMRASTKADVAITNGGGIRSGKVYPPGSTITRRDVLAELPFDNRIVVLETPGADIKAAIENGLSQLPNAGGRFPQVSGMTIEADISRPPGSRVTSIRVGGKPLDEKQDLHRRDQRLHVARRRRLHHVRQRRAAAARSRRSAARQRRDGLCPQARHGEDGRRRTDRAEVIP